MIYTTNTPTPVRAIFQADTEPLQGGTVGECKNFLPYGPMTAHKSNAHACKISGQNNPIGGGGGPCFPHVFRQAPEIAIFKFCQRVFFQAEILPLSSEVSETVGFLYGGRLFAQVKERAGPQV